MREPSFLTLFCLQEEAGSSGGGLDNSSEEIVVEYNHNDYADLIGTILIVVVVDVFVIL